MLYWVLMGVLVAAFLVVLLFLMRSFSHRERRKKEFYQKASKQRENMLRCRDADLQTLTVMPAMDLIEGVAAGVQEELADRADANDAFVLLPFYRQAAYAGYYLLSDAADRLSAFFRNSGEPLSGTAVTVVRKTGEQPFIDLIETEYAMLDDNNEAVSVDEARLRAWDDAFRALDAAQLADAIKRVILQAYEP